MDKSRPTSRCYVNSAIAEIDLLSPTRIVEAKAHARIVAFGGKCWTCGCSDYHSFNCPDSAFARPDLRQYTPLEILRAIIELELAEVPMR